MEIVRPTYQESKELPNQFAYHLPERLGQGVLGGIRFSSGLWLMYMYVSPSKPITLHYETSAWSSGISFNLTGHSEIRSSEYRQILSTHPDTDVHYVYPNPQILEEDISDQGKLKVSITLDHKTLLDFANEDEETFHPFLQGMQNKKGLVSKRGKITPEIQRALNQLVECPYSGKTRGIYLEGKTMEIFAHKLEELRPRGKGIPRQSRISASDIERIHYAAELLVRDPVNPPDLSELAGEIGMSRSKFFLHFKRVFNHSPMEYLRSHRMQVAWQLLQQGDHNITEVAFAVGFNSLSYFTRTFSAEFGLSPRQIIP